MRGRARRARRHGCDHAPAQPPRRGRGAGRGRADPRRPPSRRRPRQGKKAARRIVEQLGRDVRAALSKTRRQVSRRPEATGRLRLAVPARAKLNLDLEILGRRSDGYHDLRSTMQAIELHDLLLIEPATETALTANGLTVHNNADNSVLKAHAALERAAHRPLPAAFHLEKRIPAGSGMGGASSDAAATLKGLNHLFKLDLDLQTIAAEIGSDVPFFLHGGTALV